MKFCEFMLMGMALCLLSIQAVPLPEAKGLRAGRLQGIGMGAGAGACSYADTCSSAGYSGVCVNVTAGCCSGTVRFP